MPPWPAGSGETTTGWGAESEDDDKGLTVQWLVGPPPVCLLACSADVDLPDGTAVRAARA